MSKKKISIYELTAAALFAAMIAVGAFIKIPLPVVPFTMQVFFVVWAGVILPPICAACACGAYVLLGLAGVPVFVSGGGPSYVLSPTFGYLVGFILGAWVSAVMLRSRNNASFTRLLLASLAAIAIIYAFGVSYFALIRTVYLKNPMPVWSLLKNCLFITLPGDLLSCVAVCSASVRLRPWAMRKIRR